MLICLTVRLEFFDDIHVPSNLMFPGSFLYVYHSFSKVLSDPFTILILHVSLFSKSVANLDVSSNVQEQCWVWNNDGTEYFYDKHEWVRVRIEQEHWHEQSPAAPSEREAAAATERKSPYSITVYILDLLLWIAY